jgi:hypothetical protein
MTFEQVAILSVEYLEKEKIPYMMTGALVVNYHGKPRMTHDIDFVVNITNKEIQKITELFNKDFFISEGSIRSALAENSMFNIIHKETGSKIDFWILKDDEYNKTAFARRKSYPYQEKEISLATPEDTIISKLEWYKMSDVEKHYFDAVNIYCIQGNNLDKNYITDWCQKKSLTELWRKIQKMLIYDKLQKNKEI